jgi:putative membrane protein
MDRADNDGLTRTIWRAAVAGAVGGLVGSWAMNQFQAGWSRVAAALQERQAERRGNEESAPSGGEDATMKTADAISRRLLGRPLTRREKQAAGPVVHYVFGCSTAAVYGALAELVPVTRMAWGLPFGAAVWLGADEVAVPAFGLSRPATAFPLSTHAMALASHLVYGLTTEGVRRLVRRL